MPDHSLLYGDRGVYHSRLQFAEHRLLAFLRLLQLLKQLGFQPLELFGLMLELLDLRPLQHHERVHLPLGILPFLVQKLLFLLCSQLELVPNEHLPFKVLLFRFFPVRLHLLLMPRLLLLVLLNFMLFLHKYLYLLIFDVLLGLHPLFHLLDIRLLFDLLQLNFLHILDIILILEHLNLPGLFPGLLNLLPGSSHFILKHSHSVPKELTIFLHLLPNGPSLRIGEIL